MTNSVHPCADHYATCDHCDRCDQLGKCCMTSSAIAQANTAYRAADLNVLRHAIASDQDSRPDFPELVQADVATSTARRLLGSAPTCEVVSSTPLQFHYQPVLTSPSLAGLLTNQRQERTDHHGLIAPEHGSQR